MRSRIFALAATAVLLFSTVGMTFADTRTARVKKARAMRLVSLLPASDAIAVFDIKRFFDDALPKALSANQPMLAEVLAKITELEKRTGIDLKKFEQLAAGVSMKQITQTEIDFEPVLIATGNVNTDAIITVTRHISDGTYREEKIGGRTVYVFSAKNALKNAPPAPAGSKIAGIMDKALNSISNDVAVTTLDDRTLVFGTLARVRETLAASTRVASELTALLSVSESSVMSFAGRPVGGLSKLLPLDDDALGANIDSIKYLSGSLDMTAVGASLRIAARTAKPQQATDLAGTLDFLRKFGGSVLRLSKRPDQQAYGRLLESTKLAARGTDMTVDLTIPQSDIDALLASR